MAAGLIPDVEITGLPARQIAEATCQKFGYGKASLKGTAVHVAPYYDAEGTLVAQKSRTKDKQFKVHGDLDEALPFGAHAFPKGGKKVVVTEGEIDAMTVSQLQDNKWPVVSISCGADHPDQQKGTKIRKYFAKHLEYFRGFDEVILMFDMDKQGIFSAQCAAEVLGSRAKIAELPLKDPNECLLAGRGGDVIRAMWHAKPYRPEGIVDILSLKEAVSASPAGGIPYCFDGLNRLTYGLRTGELIGWGGGTGAGKTDIATQIIKGLVLDQGQKVGGFFLESTPVELARRFAGKVVEIPFHIPGHGTEEDYARAWSTIESSGGQLFLYDSFGINEWPAIRAKIEYLYHAEGVQFFWVDHLTAFAAADPDRERQILEEVTGAMGSLVKKLPITIHFVSHLATPEGKPHEEGGRVSMRHFKGARAIGFWCHAAFGIERNQQAEDPEERHITTLRNVKNRLFGHLTGETFQLCYNPNTGCLSEIHGSPVDTPVFADETQDPSSESF